MALGKMESERKFAIEGPLRFLGLIGLIAITAAPAFVLFLLIRFVALGVLEDVAGSAANPRGP